jgi:PAS domain S-box-containing protein
LAQFFQSQIDYIYFIYGLAFILLAHACFSIRGDQRGQLPWVWLGLFGVVHGTHEWLELIANGFLGPTHFVAVRVCLMAVSFVLLAEFGRDGTRRMRGKGPGRLVFVPMLALAASGAAFGWDGVNASSRYTLGFTGGLWAAYALFLAGRKQDEAGRGWLVAASVSLFLYAFAEGVIVPPAPFFPASFINSSVFANKLGLPIQLIRVVLALSAVISLTGYNRARIRFGSGRREDGHRPPNAFLPLAAVLAIVVIGWFAAEFAGANDERIGKNNALARVQLAASAVNPDRVASLTGTPLDLQDSDYARLLEQLRALCKANCDTEGDCGHVYCRQVYIRGLRGGSMRHLVCTESLNLGQAHLIPGTAVDRLTEKEMKDYNSAVTQLSDPASNAEGSWVRAAAPIRDFRTGNVLGQLVMDISAEDWMNSVAVDRLFCISTALAVSLLCMALFIAWDRSRESEAKGAALKMADVYLANEKRLRQITSALGEGVLVLDEKGLLTFMNPEAERLLGYRESDLKGKDAHDSVHLVNADGSRTMREDCPSLATLSTGKTFRFDTEVFTRKDGTNIPVSTVSAPVFDGETVSGTVLAFQDISRRKKMDRQREDFFAMVTHDLKSPLTAMLGYTELIMSAAAENGDADTVDMTASIMRSGQKLNRIVEDFLAVSRLEAGSLNLRESIVDIPELLGEAFDEFAASAQKKGLALDKEISGVIPKILADRLLIYRAVANLLQNAVNYTPKGGRIRLCAERFINNGSDFLVISVHDTGIGIPESEKVKVFEKYYRSDKTAGIKGSGLGLAVVKTVATAHGGKVELDSAEGKGSTFRLFIPTNRG